MYRINTFQRNVLITTDEVIFHAPTKHTLDPRTISQGIIIAEERFIRPALGYDFYNVLLSQKNRVVTVDNKASLEEAMGTELALGCIINSSEFLLPNNKDLWNYVLWKLVAECVMLTSTPDGFVQFGSEGVIHTSPPAGPMTTNGAVTPDLKSVKWVMDKKMMDRIDPLRASMHLYLCKNKGSYPLYERPCDCNEDGIPYKRKSDIMLDIYDDDENKCGCR